MPNKFFNYQELQMQLFELIKPHQVEGNTVYPRHTKSELKKILNNYCKAKYSTPTTTYPTLYDSQINRILKPLLSCDLIQQNNDETYSVSENWASTPTDPKTKEEYISDTLNILYRIDVHLLNRALSTLINQPLDEDEKEDYEFLLYALNITLKTAATYDLSNDVISETTKYLITKVEQYVRSKHSPQQPPQ